MCRDRPAADDAKARQTLARLADVAVHAIVPADKLAAAPIEGAVALVPLAEASAPLPEGAARRVVSVRGDESDEELATLASVEHAFVLLDPPPSLSRLHASRRVFASFAKHGVESAVIHHFHAPPSDSAELALQLGTQARAASFPTPRPARWAPPAARRALLRAPRLAPARLSSSHVSGPASLQVGGLLCDGLGNGVLVEPDEGATFEPNLVRTTSFGLLQGSRMRSIKTEFVSCPSCGRTLFDLQEVTAQISERTGHLPGVTIAIMGCIVNGPGEMADADFGYVGGAPGKVDLYVGKEVVQRAIPNEEACDALIELIKDNGMWEDKEEAEEGEEEAAEAEAVAA